MKNRRSKIKDERSKIKYQRSKIKDQRSKVKGERVKGERAKKSKVKGEFEEWNSQKLEQLRAGWKVHLEMEDWFQRSKHPQIMGVDYSSNNRYISLLIMFS